MGEPVMPSKRLTISVPSSSLKTLSSEEATLAFVGRGLAYTESGEAENAIRDYTTVIGLNNVPTELFALALNNRGNIYERVGEMEKAIEDYTTVIGFEDVPAAQHALALIHRGYTYVKNDDTEKAITDFSNAIELKNVSDAILVEALGNRGIIYGKRGEVEKELADYTAVLSFEDTSAELFSQVLIGRGFAYIQSGKFGEAISDFNTVINLDDPPTEQIGRAFIGRGFAHQSNGELQNAIADYTSTTQLKGVGTELVIDAYMFKAETYILVGHWSEGVKSVQKALGLSSGTTPPQHYNSRRLINAVFSTSIDSTLRKQQIAELTRLYTKHELVTFTLGIGLVEHLGSLYQTDGELPSPENLELWLSAWEEASEGVDKLRIPMRIFRTGVAFLKTGGQDLGILADLAESERSILKQAFGMED